MKIRISIFVVLQWDWEMRMYGEILDLDDDWGYGDGDRKDNVDDDDLNVDGDFHDNVDEKEARKQIS